MPRADFVRAVRSLAGGTDCNDPWQEAADRTPQLAPPPRKPARLHD
jgi:hypothetical protein